MLHRTFHTYQDAIGANSASSWGCTTVKSNRGAIVSRRIDICATTLKRLAETFPHELTHAVLADHFAGGSAPPWLDEGLAVLAEPESKFLRRARALGDEVNGAPLLRSAELFALDDYPPGQQCHAFYVESARLVDLLLRHGGPERLLRFAETGETRGYEAALREHYGWAGLRQLDQRRQEVNAAGLVAQASRERRKVTGQATNTSRSAHDDDQIVNISYRRQVATAPLAPGE